MSNVLSVKSFGTPSAKKEFRKSVIGQHRLRREIPLTLFKRYVSLKIVIIEKEYHDTSFISDLMGNFVQKKILCTRKHNFLQYLVRAIFLLTHSSSKYRSAQVIHWRSYLKFSARK